MPNAPAALAPGATIWLGPGLAVAAKEIVRELRMGIGNSSYQFTNAGYGIPDGQHPVAEADSVLVYHNFPNHKLLSKPQFELLKAEGKATRIG